MRKGSSQAKSTVQRRAHVLSETNRRKHDTIPDMISSGPSNRHCFSAVRVPPRHRGDVVLCLLSLTRSSVSVLRHRPPARRKMPGHDLPPRCVLAFRIAWRRVSRRLAEHRVDQQPRVHRRRPGPRHGGQRLPTASTVEARFYFLEPMAANSSSTDRCDSWKCSNNGCRNLSRFPSGGRGSLAKRSSKIIRPPPHAHTVEYRLNSKADLQSLYR